VIEISKYSKTIYFGSLSLQEKVKYKGTSVPHQRKINKHLYYTWKNLLGKTNERYFYTRLNWSNYADKLRVLLSDVSYDRKKTYPKWVKYIDEFIVYAKGRSIITCRKLNQQIPFEDLISFIVDFFTNKLRTRLLRKGLKLNDCLLQEAKLNLQVGLSKLTSQTFLEDMLETDAGSLEGYFTHTIQNNFRNFFKRYPVLARLVFTQAQYWVDNTIRLHQRLFEDRQYLVEQFELPTSFEVKKVITGLSDPHNNGNGVVVVEFSGSKRLIYKPRSVSGETIFYDTLSWYNNSQKKIKHYIPKILERNNYGWVEYIEHTSATSQEACKEYYKRIGSLLFFLHLYKVTDCHSENMISFGEFPVITDLETLLTPYIKNSTKYLNMLTEKIDSLIENSVLRVGLLPQWTMDNNGNYYDSSGLGNTKPQYSRYPHIEWKNINNSNISYDYVCKKVPTDKNTLMYNSAVVEPVNYINEILYGFKQSYRFCTANKKYFTSKSLKLMFSSFQSRFVYRATGIYTFLLNYLLHPDYMRNGVERSIQMDVLSLGSLVNLETKHPYWPVLDAEYMDLFNGDVPYFSCKTAEKTLLRRNKNVLRNCFKDTGYNLFYKTLSSLSEKDMLTQLDMITKSITTRKKEKKETRVVYRSQTVNFNDRGLYIDIAKQIGNKILQDKFSAGDRSCTWLGYVSNVISHTYGYKPIGLDLANGNIGVSLFLATLFDATLDARYKEACLNSLSPVFDILKYSWACEEFVNTFSIGGLTGLGSLIYGLRKIEEYLNDPELNHYIAGFVSLINKELVNRCIRDDVVSGTSGTLLALISLHDREKVVSKYLLNLIVNKLLKSAIYKDGKLLGWPYLSGKYLLGFSHGSSGILYSLSKYYELYPNDRVLKVIEDILQLESEKFQKRNNNWPDYRYDPVNYKAVSWCHGALGIGMSRLSLYDQGLFGDKVMKDLLTAFQKTSRGVHALDTLCCGNSGRIDFILELERRRVFDVDSYKQLLVSDVILNYRKNKRFSCYSNFNTPDINYGLFQGISGIGYEFLRLYDPYKYPSVLLFE